MKTTNEKVISDMKAYIMGIAAAAALFANAAEKQKFDPESVFGIAIDSHLPFDQEPHVNDTNYVCASVERIAKDVRVWGRRFRGFAPRFVSLGPDHGIESITAIRSADLETRKLPALFKAIDGYFADFSGISPAEGRSSETNRTWEGVSPDGIGYSVNVFTSIRNPDGTAQIRMTLRSESDRCGAEIRKARLEKESKARIAAAYRMMRDKAYLGCWSYWRRNLGLTLFFLKGGLGFAEYQEAPCLFYWTSDERGNVEGTLAIGEGLNAKMQAKFIPETNEFKVRLAYPQDKDFLAEMDADARDEGEARRDPRKDAMAECTLKPVTFKDVEPRACEYLKRRLGDDGIRPPLARTVPEKLSAKPFESFMGPSSTKTLSSWAELPDFAKLPKRGCWVLNGSGVCRLMTGVEEGGETLVAVTIGERVSSDENAPSYFWLKSVRPCMKSAQEFESRVHGGIPDEKCEVIVKCAEEFGGSAEERVLELDMFWHYRREDQLHVRFPAGKTGDADAFVRKALADVLKFPVKMEVYDMDGLKAKEGE